MRVLVASLGMMPEVLKMARISPFTRSLPRFFEEYFRKQQVAVCFTGNTLVGFVVVNHCIVRPYTSIYNLGVVPQGRHMGIGSALLYWVETVTPHRQIRIVVDSSNISGLAFWKGRGFVKFGSKLGKDGNVLLQMRKDIKSTGLFEK